MGKLKWLMTEEEKAEEVKKRIKRAATAMYNACKISYEENRCKGCPFNVSMGCRLYDHPINWKDKIKELNTKLK